MNQAPQYIAQDHLSDENNNPAGGVGPRPMTRIEELLDAVAIRRRNGPPLSESDLAVIEDLVSILLPLDDSQSGRADG